MNKIGTITMFLPPETYILLVVAAGFALILGARRIAAFLLVMVVASIFLPVVIEPLLDAMPLWLLLIVGILAGLAMLRGIMELLVGKASTDHVVGELIADSIKWSLMLPFRLIGWVLRLVLRR